MPLGHVSHQQFRAHDCLPAAARRFWSLRRKSRHLLQVNSDTSEYFPLAIGFVVVSSAVSYPYLTTRSRSCVVSGRLGRLLLQLWTNARSRRMRLSDLVEKVAGGYAAGGISGGAFNPAVNLRVT